MSDITKGMTWGSEGRAVLGERRMKTPKIKKPPTAALKGLTAVAKSDIDDLHRKLNSIDRQADAINREIDKLPGVPPRHPYPGLPQRINEAGRQLGSGQVHRDAKGRFTHWGTAGLAAAGFAGAGGAGLVSTVSHRELRHWDHETNLDMKDIVTYTRGGKTAEADKLLVNVQRWDKMRPGLVADRTKYGAIAGGALAAGAAGMYLHGRVNRNNVVSKGLKNKLNNVTVTGDQARHAGVFGQIGTGAGVVTGAAVGAGIGAAVRKPGQGAGIGAAVGGALGGSGGAALGLYAGRPRKKRKTLNGTAPVAKRNDTEERGVAAGIGAGVGIGGGHAVGGLAHSASHRLRREAAVTSHLADYKKKIRDARMLEDTAHFHNSVKGKVGLGVAGAAVGYAGMRRHQQHRALSAAPEPVAKVSDENKTKLARAGLIGAQVADIAAIKSAFHETTTAKKTGTGVKAALSYGSKKAALPVVAGGLVASVGAERVMHHQQQKLATQQARQARTTNP